MAEDVIVIGGGPAGLAAAHELAVNGKRTLLLEGSKAAGGIARTETYGGYRFDLGGHRFFTKQADILSLWYELLGGELLEVQRSSRIYHRGKFISYPLAPTDILKKLGLTESLRILTSYLQTSVMSEKEDASYEDWIINRFGLRLFETFFKEYTEKVWGIPCGRIEPEWAEQRIKGVSLRSAVANALFGSNQARSMIRTFLYPRLGPGMMWDRFVERIVAHGGRVEFKRPVVHLHHDGRGRVSTIVCKSGESAAWCSAQHYISSMPITTLVESLVPAPPSWVLHAARAMRYRSFLIVVLILDKNELFPDQWIYIHDPALKVGRIQNYKNWSQAMLPGPETTSLGMEYFCDEGDGLWNASLSEHIERAAGELDRLGLAPGARVIDGTVVRVPKAYPVYELSYRKNLGVILEYFNSFTNLQSIGRNGTFRYNNMDHSMISGINAARRAMGAVDGMLSEDDRHYLEASCS
jgi:protoporphyrinogen oxidase